MRNLLLTLRFVGTRYCGFQVQKNGISVAEVFQDATEAVLGHRPDIKGCSRTDAGVHALAYGLSLRTGHAIPVEKLPLALNAHLPDDIAVTACREVQGDFHARYCAVGKEYIYKICNTACRDPFYDGLALRYPAPLDAVRMDSQAKRFIGTFDFSAFCNSGSGVIDRVRTISSCSVSREGDRVLFAVTGDGFLYNMVRIMVGTLLDIEAGRLPRDSIDDIMASKRRDRAGATAPAHGLYLSQVFYPGTVL